MISRGLLYSEDETTQEARTPPAGHGSEYSNVTIFRWVIPGEPSSRISEGLPENLTEYSNVTIFRESLPPA